LIWKRSPALQNTFRHIISWTGISTGKTKTETRRGLPSWYSLRKRKGPSRQPGWSDVDITQDTTILMQTLGTARKDSGRELKGDDPFAESVREFPQAHVRSSNQGGTYYLPG
jgi:hypothetical protein